ncbi:MAG: addiction module toxin RelE, partial [Nitrococcus sp.]|nr:addiction module toxin RelE [Nitrococcus sp.]
DDKFVERMQGKMRVRGDELSIPKRQRRAPVPSLEQIAEANPDRNDAIIAAYGTGAYSYREIAAYHGLHLATVRRIVRRHWMQQCEN